LIISK